jgi:hypothetical protein
MVVPARCEGTTRALVPSTEMLSASECAFASLRSAANDTVNGLDADAVCAAACAAP